MGIHPPNLYRKLNFYSWTLASIHNTDCPLEMIDRKLTRVTAKRVPECACKRLVFSSVRLISPSRIGNRIRARGDRHRCRIPQKACSTASWPLPGPQILRAETPGFCCDISGRRLFLSREQAFQRDDYSLCKCIQILALMIFCLQLGRIPALSHFYSVDPILRVLGEC